MIGNANDIPAKCSFDVYDDALVFLFLFRTFGTKLGLDNMRALLDERLVHELWNDHRREW